MAADAIRRGAGGSCDLYSLSSYSPALQAFSRSWRWGGRPLEELGTGHLKIMPELSVMPAVVDIAKANLRCGADCPLIPRRDHADDLVLDGKSQSVIYRYPGRLHPQPASDRKSVVDGKSVD